MSFVAIAIGGGALVGAGASIYSSEKGAQSQKSAANQAAASQSQANQSNLAEYLLSRGGPSYLNGVGLGSIAGGSALLPMYMQQNGQAWEPQLGSTLISGFNASQPNMGQIQGATAASMAGVAGGQDIANSLFNGGYTGKMLGYFGPVAGANVSYTREAAMKSLNNTLNQIQAAQSSKGFSGDSYGNRMLGYQAQNIGQGQIAGANLANLQTIQGIQSGGLNTALQNAMLPYQVGQAAGQYAVMPQNIYANAMSSALQPINFLRIGPGTPPTLQPLPTPGPIPSGGQLLGQGLGALGGIGMNYGLGQLQYQQQQNLMAPMIAQNNAAFNAYGTGLTPSMSGGGLSSLGYLGDIGGLGGGAGGMGSGFFGNTIPGMGGY